MQHTPLALEELIAIIERHQASAEYERSYRCSIKLLEIGETTELDADTMCRIMVVVSKSAYYASRFDESLALLNRCEAILDQITGGRQRQYALEAALIKANVLRRIGRFKEALLVLEKAEDAECSSGNRVEKLLIEGACRYYLHDFAVAEKALEIALGLATNLSDPKLRSRILMMKALLDQSKGHLGSAEEYLIRAKEICHEQSDAYGEACTGLNLGIVLYRRGRFEEARGSIERSRSVYNQIGWGLGKVRCLLALGNIEKFCRELSRAKAAYRKALKLSRTQGFLREEALALEFLGEISAEKEEYESALELYRESLRIAGKTGPAQDIRVEVYRRMGELHVAWTRGEKAFEYLQEALVLARRIRERFEEGAILRTLGMAYSLSGDIENARVHFQKSLDVLHSIGSRFEIAKTHLFTVECLAMEINPRNEKRARPLPDIDQDRVAASWSDLVEASHLFAETGAMYWKERSNRLLVRLNACRTRRSAGDETYAGVGSLVRLTHSDDFLLREGFVCVSEPMQKVYDHARFSSDCSRPVLITGETGTGKEVVARLIHSMSERARGVFVAVNCAAIPDHLFESEFFGHRRGCFTGAVTDRRGIFEEANGGTLFLDEIGELTTLQQVKLLRVLQEKTIRRIGENVERTVDFRIVTATNQDVEAKIESASFRKDFYYRINAEQIYIPPLRERPEDIIPLITYFLCDKTRGGKQFVLIEGEALRCLQEYHWPGNVRELFNLLERLRDLGNGDAIHLEMLPERIRDGSGRRMASVMKRAEDGEEYREKLKRVLTVCKGNKSAAARLLGISRGTLYKDLRRSGLFEHVREKQAS
jgi:transcriptional regulator with AAA-type ATPase domain/tetratricopeptide (TPR) repeat protein